VPRTAARWAGSVAEGAAVAARLTTTSALTSRSPSGPTTRPARRSARSPSTQATPAYERAGKPYNDAFRRYLVSGQADERTLKIAEGEKGGYLVPMQFSSRFIQKLDDELHIRRISDTVVVTEAGSLGVGGIETDPSDAEWTSEVSDTDVSDDEAMQFSRRELKPNVLMKRVDISKTLLRRSARADEIVADRLGYVVGRAEENGFINGSGSSQPLGLFAASTAGLPAARDVNLGSTSAITADGLIKMQMHLKAGHRRRGKWLMSRDAVEGVRLLKDQEDRYLWRPGLTDMEPDRLLGKEICESELAPNTFSSGEYILVYGNFDYYMIATALTMDLLRDPYSAAGKNKQRFIITHESDGMPVLAEAFSRGKLST
jgi:HK97 family phage major capsid protein